MGRAMIEDDSDSESSPSSDGPDSNPGSSTGSSTVHTPSDRPRAPIPSLDLSKMMLPTSTAAPKPRTVIASKASTANQLALPRKQQGVSDSRKSDDPLEEMDNLLDEL